MTSEDFTTLRIERVGQVLRVTFDHPSSVLNAVDDALHCPSGGWVNQATGRTVPAGGPAIPRQRSGG